MKRVRNDLRPVETNGQLSFKELLRRCNRDFYDDEEITRKVKWFVKSGLISSTQPRGYNTLLYLPKKSQEIVINIYRNLRNLRFADIPARLINIVTAATSINLDKITLNYLLNRYGEEHSLADNSEIPLCLSIAKTGRYGKEPKIPFVKWIPVVTDAPRYLATPVVQDMRRYFSKIEIKRRSSWARKLIDLIREDEERRQKFLYFQHQQ